MTEKLFYIDSHLTEFTAKVLSCKEGKNGWEVVLDRTAFYPEGGGQPADHGTLDGAAVTDVREKDGQIVHFCGSALKEGAEVAGHIDAKRRLRFMQQHSGEHMVSGLIHKAYGYNNTGFHMGKDAVTIDFDGIITEEQLKELERQVNEEILRDVPVEVFYPDAETLASLPYRSKKELTGAVRLVRFPDVDLCACCGTHVQRTGEIGLVKFLSCVRFREGVRIEMLAGAEAVEYLSAVWEQNRQISGLLSARPLETAAAAARMQQELSDTKYRLAQLEDRLFRQKAEELREKGDVLLFEEELSPDSLRRLTDAVLQVCGGRCAVFSKTAEGFRYAMGQKDGDLRTFTKAMNEALCGRGGGKPGFVQGSVTADRIAVEAFFREVAI